MGKVADRLSRRNDPAYARAKAIVRIASAFEQDGKPADFEQLRTALEAALAQLSPSDFDHLLSMALDAALPRRDADAVTETLTGLVQELCEVSQEATSDPRGHLVAIALDARLAPSLFDLDLSEAQCLSLEQILKDHELVDDAATVTFVPRILSTAQCDLLRHGEVFRVNRMLAQGKAAEALALIQQATPLRDTDDRRRTATAASIGAESSAGILVALVSSYDAEPFPLAMELDHALGLADENLFDEIDDGLELDEDATAASEQEALDDVDEVLRQAARCMAQTLGRTELRILWAPSDWYASATRAWCEQREAQLRGWLSALSRQHSHDDLAAFYVSPDIWPDGTRSKYAQVKIHRRSDHRRLGSFNWYPASVEDIEASADELVMLMDEMGLSISGPDDSDGSLVVRGREPVH
jgi:hypothetical protein